MKLNKYIQKSCCFYASDWHLTVMLLPYINNKVQENCSIYMKCENNIEEKMNILVNKLTLKNKKNIMNINWGNLVAEDDVDDNEKIYGPWNNQEFQQGCQTNWRLSSPERLIKVRYGHCFDQVELERDWFNNHNYNFF